MDHAEMTAALEACVVTDEEMDQYEETFLKAQPMDILKHQAALGGDEELAKKIRQYEIEILAPKNKKTQILAATPKSTTPVSAHACIAVYQGTIEAKAGFKIDRYLRYAHLLPELASGLVKEFALPVGATADAQTALLADQIDGDGLSGTIASLNAGDKVELEWLQIRVEYDTDVDEDRYSVIEQCQLLAKVNRTREKALLRQYPQPQIMIPKDRVPVPGSCGVGGGQNPSTSSAVGGQETTAKPNNKNGKKKGKKGKKNRG